MLGVHLGLEAWNLELLWCLDVGAWSFLKVSAYRELQTQLGYRFRDPGLLQLALTHPSIAHEQGVPVQTNQRLEFLGDAVLQLVLTRELYDKFPAFGEGPLTKARAKLVNRRTLAERAWHLGLGSHLIVSRGEELHGGRERPGALADTFEALLGAIFLDGGFEASREFILDQFIGAFGELSALPILENPKGELQELLQSISSEAPHYRVDSATCSDREPRWLSGLAARSTAQSACNGPERHPAVVAAASRGRLAVRGQWLDAPRAY